MSNLFSLKLKPKKKINEEEEKITQQKMIDTKTKIIHKWKDILFYQFDILSLSKCDIAKSKIIYKLKIYFFLF